MSSNRKLLTEINIEAVIVLTVSMFNSSKLIYFKSIPNCSGSRSLAVSKSSPMSLSNERMVTVNGDRSSGLELVPVAMALLVKKSPPLAEAFS